MCCTRVAATRFRENNITGRHRVNTAVLGIKSMNTDPEVAKGLLDIENEMRRMLDGQSQPYDAAWKIWGKAMSLTSPSSNVMHAFWLIWGSLTDWVENRPDETLQAETKMRQAAKEWLELNRDDANEEKAYLDRWVYDEMGYARDTN
ncbi:hypothetical protein [Roseimaritima ulvae]|uniref:Uncharacterized protein n=1 Tax=Roseimaritima ulvae TaxID=980254 RepID=A0A5B9QSZ6_9BACT|nr:hypothetical protein [Roseimaritima ulvae]QEG40196.1 hypothetical protein UC8_22020 [Roseimaritima ulvae]